MQQRGGEEACTSGSSLLLRTTQPGLPSVTLDGLLSAKRPDSADWWHNFFLNSLREPEVGSKTKKKKKD